MGNNKEMTYSLAQLQSLISLLRESNDAYFDIRIRIIYVNLNFVMRLNS